VFVASWTPEACSQEATLRLLESLRYLPLSPGSALLAGKWRADFRAQGITLSLADCLVGATAVEHAANDM
jgi:predicted nucleic acid-binding protein